MSGIAGVWNLDGRPVAREILEAMTRAAAHRGPDGVGYWLEGPVGFAHQKLATTPEAERETQPLTDESGMLRLAFDGRIDNRDDLARDLRARGVEARDLTDAELVLWSYRVWGSDCAVRFLGDFAFALWDARQREIFCARDILGWKPFHYYLEGNVFAFASQPAQLLAHPDVPCEPDETTVAVHLASVVHYQGDRSFFRGIHRLLPACWMIVRPGSCRIERYWSPEPRELRCQSDADYAAHFREVFREAVRCRLRSSGRVGAYLSGGLDSSSVTGMTQSLLREGSASAPGFDVFSLVFPGRPSCDETPYIRAVKEMWGLAGSAIDPETEDFHRYAEHVRTHFELPFYPNGAMLSPLLERARDEGFRVILTGLGGDDWLAEMPFDLADRLRERRVLAVARELRRKDDLENLWRFGLRPLLVSCLPRWLRRAARRRKTIPSWLGPELARRTRFRELCAQSSTWEGTLGFALSERLFHATRGWPLHAAEMEERLASSFGIEYRHPFHDRRVIELALALPREQRVRDGLGKFILREAARRLLPREVRERRTKAEFSSVMSAGIEAVARSSESLDVESRGWVRGEEVRRMYGEFVDLRARGGEPRGLWVLWKLFALELWLRIVFNGERVAVDPMPLTGEGRS